MLIHWAGASLNAEAASGSQQAEQTVMNGFKKTPLSEIPVPVSL